LPVSPLRPLLIILLLAFLLGMIQVNLLVIAFDKLGLSPSSALLLLFSALIGSAINLPVARLRAEKSAVTPTRMPVIIPQPRIQAGWTVIAVNVGGCIIPVLFSLFLVSQTMLPLLDILVATLIVSLASYLMSRPVAGIGVMMPILAAPIIAAMTAILINVEYSAPLAYISGTMGVIIGADLLRLNEMKTIGAPVASIGGAGTFDGIFLTGIVAALLA